MVLGMTTVVRLEQFCEEEYPVGFVGGEDGRFLGLLAHLLNLNMRE